MIAALYLRTGFGYAFDFAFATVIAAIAIPLTALIVALLLTIARRLPRMATGVMVGAGLIVMAAWGPPQLGIWLALLGVLAEGLLGATLAAFITGGFSRAAISKKVITVLLFVFAVGINYVLVWLFVQQGSMEKLLAWRPPAASLPPVLAAPNPSARGTYAVKMLFYGSGTDIRRAEYGRTVAIRTHSVDASDFFKDFKGWKRWARKKYWGFDVDREPLKCPRLVSRERGAVSAGVDRAWKSQHGGVFGRGLRVSWGTPRQPRVHPGVDRRKFPE